MPLPDHDLGREPLAERLLTLAAMVGSAGGAVAGVALGARTGSAVPDFGGVLGAAVGAGLVAGAWHLLACLWAARPVGRESGRTLATVERFAAQEPGAR